MRQWLGSLINPLLNCSRSSMLPLSRFPCPVSLTMRRHFYVIFPEKISCKLALLVFKCLNGLVLPYLVSKFHRVADTESRQQLRFTSTMELIIPRDPRIRRTTIGDHAFSIAAAQVLNSLPPSVTASSLSLTAFKTCTVASVCF
jgi:hypothetical protein